MPEAGKKYKNCCGKNAQYLHLEDLTESKKLEEVMQGVWKFIVQEIDDVGKTIIDEYNKKTREELLAYGVANIKLASIEALSEPRIVKKEKS